MAGLSDNGIVSTEPVNQPDSAGPSAYASSETAGPRPVPSRMAPRELLRWIEAFCNAPTLQKRTAALIGLVGWMRKPGASIADLSGLPGLVEYLEVNLEEKAHFQVAFADLLS